MCFIHIVSLTYMIKLSKILIGLFLCGVLVTSCVGSANEGRTDVYTLDGVDYQFGQSLYSDSCGISDAPGSIGLRINYNLAYVVEEGSGAEVAAAINNEIVKYELGCEFDGVPMQNAVDSVFKEMKSEYMLSSEFDASDSSLTYCPIVFHEYKKDSKFIKGKGNVVCYECHDYICNDSTGGEHGHWVLNFDGRSGKVMHYADVFDPLKDAHVRQLVQRQLMADLNLEYNLALETPQDLKNYGYVFSENLLPATHVFMLGEEGVTFIYEVYSIAPCEMGTTHVTVLYEDIEYCITEEARKVLFQ